MARTLAWLRAEVDYLTYRTGIRGYCWVCDDLRWAWTHRRCSARNYAAARRLLDAIERGDLRPPT